MQPTRSFKAFKKLFYISVIFLIIAVFGYKLLINKKLTTSKKVDPKIIATEDEKKVSIGKEFEFKIPVINDQGQILAKEEEIKFIITEAALKEEIKLKGEAKKANQGQKYLILRIELQNDSSDRLAIISSKYIRLIGQENKKFSPDFHNAMVAIDPLSVRRDIVAYIVNNDSKNFTFQVGELEGEKQSLEIVF